MWEVPGPGRANQDQISFDKTLVRMKAQSQLNTQNFYRNNVKAKWKKRDKIDQGYDMIKFFRR